MRWCELCKHIRPIDAVEAWPVYPGPDEMDGVEETWLYGCIDRCAITAFCKDEYGDKGHHAPYCPNVRGSDVEVRLRTEGLTRILEWRYVNNG